MAAAINTIYPPCCLATAEQIKLTEYDLHKVNAKRSNIFVGNFFPNGVQIIAI